MITRSAYTVLLRFSFDFMISDITIVQFQFEEEIEARYEMNFVWIHVLRSRLVLKVA